MKCNAEAVAGSVTEQQNSITKSLLFTVVR